MVRLQGVEAVVVISACVWLTFTYVFCFFSAPQFVHGLKVRTQILTITVE